MNDPLGLMGDDPLGLNGDDPLGLGREEPPEDGNSLLGTAGELAKGVANTATGIASGIGAVGSTLMTPTGYDPLGLGKYFGIHKDESTDPVKRFFDSQEAFQNEYRPFKDEGAMRAEGFIGENLDKLREFGGDVAVTMKDAFSQRGNPSVGGRILAQEMPEELARGAGEVVTDLAADPFALGLGAARARGARISSEKARAEQVLAEKMAEEARTSQQAQREAELQKMQDALRDLDNQMQKYGKDLQAPQLGLGGKVARHDDQVGKRAKGEFSNQMAFDEDIRLQAEEQATNPQGNLRVPSILDDYDPIYTGRTQDHAPFPVRPFQTEMPREKRISEGEATKLYMKPKWDLTLEEKLKLKDYEASLRQGETGGIEPLGSESPSDWYNQRLGQVQEAIMLESKFGANEGMIGRYTFRDQLDTIATDSKNPALKEVAKLLLNDPQFNPRFEIVQDTRSRATHASYLPDLYKIQLRPEHLGDEALTVHEAVHARTHSAIEGALRKQQGFEHLEPAVRRLQDLYVTFKDHHNKFGANADGSWTAHYGLTNIHEFIAEAFSNKSFQDVLAKTPVPKGIKSNWFKNYWDLFVDAIGKALGFDRKHHNYLSETIKAGADIMHGADINHRRWFETSNRRHGAVNGEMIMDDMGIPKEKQDAYWRNLSQQERDDLFRKYRETTSDSFGGYSLRDFEQDLKAKGVKLPKATVRAMYDAQQPKNPKPTSGDPMESTIETVEDIPGLSDIQKHYYDTRPFEQIVKESENSKDISFLSKHVIQKMIQGKFTAKDHPLMSWVSSQMNMVRQGALNKANHKLHGRNRNNPSEGTYNYVWRQLTAKEREDLNLVGWELNNEPGQMTPESIQAKAREVLGRELSRKQLQSYLDRVRINKEVLADVNKLLEANGKEPIPELPNYWSPNQFDGPFLLKFVNKETGETTKIVSSYLRPNVDKLAPNFPEYRLDVVEKGLKNNLDFDQLDWVLRHLNKELRDPAARAISEGLRRQGFSRHGLKRKMVEGGLGATEVGATRAEKRRSLREYEETAEKYIRQAYDFIGNRELDTLYNKVLDEKKLDGVPLAKAYSLESIDTARGGANQTMEGLSRLLGEAFRGTIQIGTLGKLQLPQKALRDLTRHSNKVMTSLLLGFGNITHITAQLLQAPTYMPPKLLEMAIRAKKNPLLVFKAMNSASAEMLKWDQSADVAKLRELGTLDPTFKYDWSTYASDSDPRYQASLRDHLSGMSLLSGIEANAVRRPASLMFLHMLRELGYDKIAKTPDEIYHVAKEMTDQYMVSTKWYEKPHMFSRSGLVGTAMSPLQSFTTTWAGMLREYSKFAVEGKGNPMHTIPLATFLAMNLVTAGMLGFVGIKEWDAIAHVLNTYLGYNVPGGSEWVLSKFKSDKMRFGLLSDSVGMHVGSTFNAPTLTGSFAPGLQLITGVVKAAVVAGREYLHEFAGIGKGPTAVEKRDAIKALTPRFSPVPGVNWGDVEKRFTPEGMPYQDLAGNAGPVTRDDKDWLARRLGTYSTKEATEKVEHYTAKRKADERSKRLSGTIERVVDVILTDPARSKEKIGPMLQSLSKDGFTGTDINAALKRELNSKMLESDVRNMKGSATSRKAYIQQLLKELR
jgi:hypothetical protein